MTEMLRGVVPHSGGGPQTTMTPIRRTQQEPRHLVEVQL
jgi:hypothetical protein